MRRRVVAHHNAGIVSGAISVGDEVVTDFGSVHEKCVDTIVMVQEVSHLSGENGGLLVIIIDPMVQRILVTLNSEDIQTISS